MLNQLACREFPTVVNCLNTFAFALVCSLLLKVKSKYQLALMSDIWVLPKNVDR